MPSRRLHYIMFLIDGGGDDALENHTLLEEGLAQCCSGGGIQATRASGTSAVFDGPAKGASTGNRVDSSWDCTSRQATGATRASGGVGQYILQSVQKISPQSSIHSHSNRSMSG